ncbi:ComEC family competence protein [Flavobacteriaceae bacterium]|nr:ComEC family competence protein [Flavobacteriaceae bacterium]
MKALHYPLLKLTIFLAIGILLSDYIVVSIPLILGSIGLMLFVLIGTHFYCKKHNKTLYWPSLVVLLMMVLLGVFVSKIHSPTVSKSHYSHLENITDDDLHQLEFIVKKRLKPNTYNHRYYVELLKVDSTSVSGTLLINLSKESNTANFNVNEKILTVASLKEVNAPLNPYQFDYKNYLKRLGIYRQVYLKNQVVLAIRQSPTTITAYAETIREALNKRLQQLSFKPIERAFIKALLLGQRQDIRADVYEAYTKAGAIHILAISGLHIGILLLILQFILKPILYFGQGKFVRLLIILCVLWSFAVIAGLSPSVVRAVTMFSLFAAVRVLKRSSNSLNILAVSAFILLLVRPGFCFEVGFQLSYAAVASIIIVKPVLDSWGSFKNRILNWFLDLFKVSIAAQIGVLPLSLYYFHQFPGLFFVTNMVVVPCLIVILGLGIATLILVVIYKPPEFLVHTLAWIIQSMNRFVEWVASKETFLFEQISFDLTALVISYLLLFLLGIFYHKKTFKNLLVLGICIVSFQVFVKQIPALTSKNSFVVFHKSRHSVFGLQSNQHLEIHHDLDSINNQRMLEDYNIGAGIKTQSTDSIRCLYKIDDKLLLVVDSLGVYTVKSVKPQWILLRQSPKINLNRLIDSLKPELIIWDGSNYRTYQERWKLTCTTKKIPFHQTSEKGFFRVDY